MHSAESYPERTRLCSRHLGARWDGRCFGARRRSEVDNAGSNTQRLTEPYLVSVTMGMTTQRGQQLLLVPAHFIQ